MKRTRTAGIPCPTDPEHGPLIEIDGRPYCQNQAHDGRPKTHPMGYAPRTSPYPDSPPPMPHVPRSAPQQRNEASEQRSEEQAPRLTLWG